jgi:hypothetical protein
MFTRFGEGENLVHELHAVAVTDGNGHGIWVYLKTNKGNYQAIYLLLLLMGDAKLISKE